MESKMTESNILELKDDLKNNVMMKINGTEIHRIQEYKIQREPLSKVTLELKISIDGKKSSIDIKN